MMKKSAILFVLILFFALVFSACSGNSPTTINNLTPKPVGTMPATSSGQLTGSTENALAPETNPVGDIPDNQVFISYSSPNGGYSLEVPEGWARSEQGTDVRFVDKFDGVGVTLGSASSAPTVDIVAQTEAATLAQSERAFKLGAINIVNLPAGSAVQIKATANSDPDPVTGKQVRLEEEFYLFYQNGKLAVLKLWAPQGADNVDQWKRISESFTWK
jgi:hypothetical protein